MKLDIRARIEEAYAALKAMVKEEERSRPRTEVRELELIGLTEETDVAHAEVEEQCHGTTGEGAEQDTLSTCQKEPIEDKVEMRIAGTERDQRFQV